MPDPTVFDELFFFVGQADGRIARNLGLSEAAANIDRLPEIPAKSVEKVERPTLEDHVVPARIGSARKKGGQPIRT